MNYLTNKLMTGSEYALLMKLLNEQINLADPSNTKIQELLDKVLDTICAASIISVKKTR